MSNRGIIFYAVGCLRNGCESSLESEIVLYLYTYSAVNSYRLEYILCVISIQSFRFNIFKKSLIKSLMDVLNEIDFIKDKLYATGYQEMLYIYTYINIYVYTVL